MEKLYPLTLKLSGKLVLIIGAGNIALRKTRGLMGTGAKITVISPEILPEFKTLKNITLINRMVVDEDLTEAHLIYIATNNKVLNKEIARKAQNWQWVNDVSNAENSSFYTPAVVREEGLVIGISTEISDPKKAKYYKEKIQHFFKKPI